MLQGFDETANPAQGAPRLAALRARMQAEGLAGWAEAMRALAPLLAEEH